MHGQRVRRVRRVSFWLIATLVILGCSTPLFATATPQPNQSLDGSLGTAIVLTANAAQTQTATFLPTATITPLPTQFLVPTQTLAPTQTPPILVSFTPTATPGFLIIGTDGTLVSVTPAIIRTMTPVPSESAGSSNHGRPTQTEVVKPPKEWACKILERNPANGSSIKQKTNFTASWTVENSGTKVWPNYGVDFVYFGGLHNEGRAKLDLPSTVSPGSTITLRVDFVTPKNLGTYNVTWSLVVGKTQFCIMKITFDVVE